MKNRQAESVAMYAVILVIDDRLLHAYQPTLGDAWLTAQWALKHGWTACIRRVDGNHPIKTLVP
jgi:hypothetical protein